MVKIEKEIEKNRQKDSLLFQQAKLASMEEMIENIAHQWRQPLNIVSMLFQKIYRLHKNGLLDHEAMSDALNQAMTTISQMSKTIDDFRIHFEPNKEKVSYSLYSVIENIIALLEQSLKFVNISLEISVQRDIELFGFPDDLKQVLLHLINNAKDTIIFNNISDGTILIEISPSADKSEAIIRIYDNGGGIDTQYLDKIFEPYFTTKHKSQGTGISLYMSKRIVEERLCGSIAACNTENGAFFTIFVPTYTHRKG
jgi:signal transduction histidine kinase